MRLSLAPAARPGLCGAHRPALLTYRTAPWPSRHRRRRGSLCRAPRAELNPQDTTLTAFAVDAPGVCWCICPGQPSAALRQASVVTYAGSAPGEQAPALGPTCSPLGSDRAPPPCSLSVGCLLCRYWRGGAGVPYAEGQA